MKMTPEQLGFHRGSAPSWPRFGPVGATVGFAMEGGWLLCCHTQPPSLQGMAGAPCPSAGWGRAVLPARGAVCTAGRAASALCCQPRREQRFHHHLLPQPHGKHSWGCGLHQPPLRSALGGSLWAHLRRETAPRGSPGELPLGRKRCTALRCLRSQHSLRGTVGAQAESHSLLCSDCGWCRVFVRIPWAQPGHRGLCHRAAPGTAQPCSAALLCATRAPKEGAGRVRPRPGKLRVGAGCGMRWAHWAAVCHQHCC